MPQHSTLMESKQAPTWFRCKLPFTSWAIVRLLNQPLDQRIFQPADYLSASHEIFGITLIITWTITLIFRPEQVVCTSMLLICDTYTSHSLVHRHDPPRS